MTLFLGAPNLTAYTDTTQTLSDNCYFQFDGYVALETGVAKTISVGVYDWFSHDPTVTVGLYNSSRVLLSSADITGSPPGFLTANLSVPVAITEGETYFIVVRASFGAFYHYQYSSYESFTSPQGAGLPNPLPAGSGSSTGRIAVAVNGDVSAYSIISVNDDDPVPIGSTVDIDVLGFTKAITKGTIDTVALSSASSTSITLPPFVDGTIVPRVGLQALFLSSADDTESASKNIEVVAPIGLTSVEIVDGFNTGEDDSVVYNFDPPMAAGRFIFFDPSKGTVFPDAGYEGSYTGTQTLWDYDPVTRVVLGYELITGPDGEVVSVNSLAEKFLSERSVAVRGLASRGI